MKLFSRISATAAIATAALLSASSGAFAQTAPTAPSYNYVGIGGGDHGFVVNSKLSVANNASVRPEVSTNFNFNDGSDVSYLVPVTYDFNTIGTGRTAFNPFLGAGVAGDIGSNSNVDFALVAGSDYRLTDKYVANASVNYVPFGNNNDVGFTVGVGRQF